MALLLRQVATDALADVAEASKLGEARDGEELPVGRLEGDVASVFAEDLEPSVDAVRSSPAQLYSDCITAMGLRIRSA